MAKDKKFEEDIEHVVAAEVPEPAAAVPAPHISPPIQRPITFEQWATRRGAKVHHRRGLKAFAKDDAARPMEAWDILFDGYLKQR